MLNNSLDAFVNRDVALARQVVRDDDLVDDLHERVIGELIDHMIGKRSRISQAIHLIYLTKYLERIGDHIFNIDEMVVFMGEGEDIRHLEKVKGLLQRKGDSDSH